MLAWLAKQTRRARTGYATGGTAEDHNAWLGEQVAAYATPQPYAAPLTNAADNWTGETWEMREGYRRFAVKEPSVKSALLTKCLAVSQLDLQVIAADKGDKQSREVAQWVKWSISHTNGGTPALVQKMLIHALIDGFSVTEKVQGIVAEGTPKYAGFWTLENSKAKDSRGIRFRLDRYKNVVAVRSMIAAQGGMEFDPADFLIFTHLPLFENPFGVSDLRAANRAANLIEAAIKLRSILLENFSGPYLKAKSDDTGARSKLHETLKYARARGYIIIGKEDEVEVINLATSAPDQFQSAIEDLRREIVTAIQGAYLQLLEGGVSDGRGNTSVHKGIAELFQWWLATCVCSVLNKSLVPDLVYPNYGHNVGLPTVQLGGIDPASVAAELDRFSKGRDLLGAKKLSARQVMEVGGFESPEDENDVLADPPGQGAPGGADPNAAPGGGPDLSDVFGGGEPEPAPTTEGGGNDDDGGDVSLNFLDGSAVRAFSEERYSDMTLADRSHLVKKVIQDKTGTHRTVWVNPNKGDHGDPAGREQPRTGAREALANALAGKGTLTADHVKALPDHLATLNKAELKEVAKKLRLKVSDTKKHLIDRLIAHVKGAPQPKRPEGPDTLYKVVRRFGGIDPKSLAFLANYKGVKEAMDNGLSLGLFKTGGRGMDQLAQELHNVGYLKNDEPEHLLDELKKGAKQSYQLADATYDDALADYYKQQQEADAYAKANPKAGKKVATLKDRIKKAEADFGKLAPIEFADATPSGAPSADPVAALEAAVDRVEAANADVRRALKLAGVVGTLSKALKASRQPA